MLALLRDRCLTEAEPWNVVCCIGFETRNNQRCIEIAKNRVLFKFLRSFARSFFVINREWKEVRREIAGGPFVPVRLWHALCVSLPHPLKKQYPLLEFLLRMVLLQPPVSVRHKPKELMPFFPYSFLINTKRDLKPHSIAPQTIKLVLPNL